MTYVVSSKRSYQNFSNHLEDYKKSKKYKEKRFKDSLDVYESSKRFHPKQTFSIESYQNRRKKSKRDERPLSSECHSDGHIRLQIGLSFDFRYTTNQLLGQGTFGKVIQCWDEKKKQFVALKIVRNIKKYREAAEVEIEILQFINKKQSSDKKFFIILIILLYQRCSSNCLFFYVEDCLIAILTKRISYVVRLLDSFSFNGHKCLVFELLSLSLYDFMKRTHFKPLSIRCVQSIAFQILQCVDCNFIHSKPSSNENQSFLIIIHGLKLTHTDLKPENIMFVYPIESINDENSLLLHSNIRLIDFGSATFENRHHTRIVSTRHYRAPEVILELGWSYECDVWSVACILMEIYTGTTMFQTHDDLEHLTMMEQMFGFISERILRKTRKPELSNGYRLRRTLSRASIDFIQTNCKPLNDYLVSNNSIHKAFLHLIKKMFYFETKERITCKAALSHHFFDIKA